eukprot:4928770-Prymnesium_polylepis.2
MMTPHAKRSTAIGAHESGHTSSPRPPSYCDNTHGELARPACGSRVGTAEQSGCGRAEGQAQRAGAEGRRRGPALRAGAEGRGGVHPCEKEVGHLGCRVARRADRIVDDLFVRVLHSRTETKVADAKRARGVVLEEPLIVLGIVLVRRRQGTSRRHEQQVGWLEVEVGDLGRVQRRDSLDELKHPLCGLGGREHGALGFACAPEQVGHAPSLRELKLDEPRRGGAICHLEKGAALEAGEVLSIEARLAQKVFLVGEHLDHHEARALAQQQPTQLESERSALIFRSLHRMRCAGRDSLIKHGHHLVAE